MCSWCYGFAPEMDRVLAALDGKAKLIVQSGGLRPFNKEPMTEEDKPRFRGYREQVQARARPALDWSFFDREGYVMDTEPASRAVVTMRAMELDSYTYLHAIQRAYFAANEDIRQADVLARHAAAFGVAEATFHTWFESDGAREATLADFERARRFGVDGFPTLVLLAGGRAYGVAIGYAKAQTVLDNIDRALAAAWGED